MRSVVVDLYISADEYLTVYQGVARDVFAIARDGRKIRFPANILQSFVTNNGIQGTFIISFDDDNKFQGIRRQESHSSW